MFVANCTCTDLSLSAPASRVRDARRDPGHMAIARMDHIGIVVKDLDAAKQFFLDLGMEIEGETSVAGEFVDRITGLEGARSVTFARLQWRTIGHLLYIATLAMRQDRSTGCSVVMVTSTSLALWLLSDLAG